MASQPTNSSLADRYAQMSRISEMLDSLIGLDTSTPSGTFTTGPNRGLPVAAMPPSVTPFRQKSGPRRVSKVTAEAARARAGRTARPAADQPVGPPKPKQAAPTKPVAKQPRPGPRPALYSTRGVGEKMAAPVGRPETKAAPRRQPLGPSALSQTLGRINAAPASSIYQSAPGLTREDYRQAQEIADLGRTEQALATSRAMAQRGQAESDIARTQQQYAQGDADFRRRMAELDADAYAKYMAAGRAGHRAAVAAGRASQAADALGNFPPSILNELRLRLGF